MPTVVLHIGPPAAGARRPSICLEEVCRRTGALTTVDGTLVEVPEALLTNCSKLLDELRQSGGEATARAHIGVELYGYLAQTSAGREWLRRCKAHDIRDDDEQPGLSKLRTYLHIEPESLQRLPWELMIESAAENSFAPFRSANHLAARGQPRDLAEREATRRHAMPLSVLVAIYDIGLNLTEEESFRATPQAEVDAIFAALRKQPGMWQVEVLRQPTEENLKHSLETLRPKILHFIGEPSGQDDPKFVVKLADGNTEPFEFPALVRILAEIKDPPRLFFLNGCRTADMASPEVFRRLGTKAVIANQAIVYGPPAILFTKIFYRQLVKKCDVAEAVRAARAALWGIQRHDQYDWGIPVLTLYDGPKMVIQDNMQTIAKSALAMIQAGGFGQAEWHFDRLRQSRQVWNCVGSHRQIALISGRPGIGKSLLMRTCMLTWKLRGYPAVLFDAWEATRDNRDRADIRTVLRHICEELKAELGSGPLIADLDVLLEKVRGASFAGNGDTDATNPYEPLCQQLISILREAAATRPLMLAFDSLGDFYQEDLQKLIKKHIFRPIARGLVGHTYLVIATNHDVEPLFDRREPEWDGWIERVRLGKFPSADAIPLAHEYGARRGWFGRVDIVNGNDQMANWIKKVSGSPDLFGSWSPIDLRDLAVEFELEWARGRE